MVVNKHVIYLSEEQLRTPLQAHARERLDSFRQQKPVWKGLVVKEHGDRNKKKTMWLQYTLQRVRTLQNLARVEGRGKTMESLKRQTKDTISVEWQVVEWRWEDKKVCLQCTLHVISKDHPGGRGGL